MSNIKTVLVLGLGLHGGAIGTIEWLAKKDAKIIVSDTKSKEQLAPSIEKLKNIPNITYRFGNQDELNLNGIDIVIRNPAVPRKAAILERARTMGIPVEMDSSLFFEHCGTRDIIGVTGSKGKTTTASAIHAVMRTIDPKTIAIGIDGISPLGELLRQNSSDSPAIFELSSWRLEALQEKKISPHIGVCTSLYRDHLNTYKNFDEYINVKKQIIKDQRKNDIAILNADDERIRAWAKDVQGKLYWYSLKPLEDDKKGVWVNGNTVFINLPASSTPISSTFGVNGETPRVFPIGVFPAGRRIYSGSDIPHQAPHELRNKLPAILIGLLYGGNIQTIIAALAAMPPLAHRLQLIRTVGGVNYVNDSAATMPDATIAALSAYAEKPLILILGGSDKALEFEELAQKINAHKNIKHLVWLPGTATARMQEAIAAHTNAEQHDATTMDEAVQIASRLAHVGDTVLLSPGATSFGLFLHEFDRGNAFIRAIENIASEH